MNIQNQIHINQTINLDEVGLISRQEIAPIYDQFLEKLNAFSAIVEILSESSSTCLDAGKLYFLLLQQEENLNEVLTNLEQLMH